MPELPGMRLCALAIQEFGDVHAHEARSAREAGSYSDLDTAARQIDLARLDAGPVPLGLAGEARDGVVHSAKLYASPD